MNKGLMNFIGTKLRPVELILLAKVLLGVKRGPYTLADGRIYNIDPISNLGLTLINKNEYEPDMSKVINELLHDADTFVDLGSNEGYFSVLGGRLCGHRGKVFAIEPQSRLWDVIVKNTISNDLCNVQLLPFGIGSKKEELILNLYSGLNSGASTFSSKFNFNVSILRRFFLKKERIKIITLDDLIDVFPANVQLLKIDIEGFEMEAIQGAKKLLAEKVFKNILIEIHHEALKGMNQSEEELNKILENTGYKNKKVSHDLNLYYL